MTYGAVYTSLYADDGMSSSTYSEYYNPDNASYYFDGAAGQQDHAVDIVGWDDNYAATNFSEDYWTDQPPGNGAFIVRNSWGTSWGDNGYFYVSYYDTNFAYQLNAVFNDAESTSNYNAVYQYDPLGWVNGIGYGDGSITDWAANKFTATASAQLAAVGFYAAEPGTSYTVYAGSSLSSLTAKGSGSVPFGYRHRCPELPAAADERPGLRGGRQAHDTRRRSTPSPSSIPPPAQAMPLRLPGRATSAPTAARGPT